MPRFILEIELGNDAMRTGYDVAHSIRDVAFSMQDHGNLTALKYQNIKQTPIRDINGNIVGHYEVTE